MAPKYERIADGLRKQIEAGALAAGARMPAHTALAEQENVSLPTIQQALGVLENEGLIETIHGVGTFVRSKPQKIHRKPDRYQWEKNRALQSLDERQQTGGTEYDTGLNVDDLAFECEYRVEEAPQELAEAFGVATGTMVLHRIYRTFKRGDKVALSMSDSYLLYDVVAANPDLLDVTKEPWPGGTHHQLRTIGVEIDRVIDQISARPPRGDESEYLDIRQGVSVLTLRKISYDINGRVIEVADAILPGDRTIFEYETKLERWPS
jgi:GntR family transcriptional regulator